MQRTPWLRIVGAGLLSGAIGLAGNEARSEIPDALYRALGLSRDASPAQLYDALVQRYRDPAQGAGKGKFADLWEPIAISRYFDPASFYRPPGSVDLVAKREDCVTCHEQVNPGWVHSWQKSAHGNLQSLRALPAGDPRAYKKGIIAEVEANLRSMGLLPADRNLEQVSCIDCHVGVGRTEANHKTDLRMPDAATCGQCHLQQFAERESERDTLTWPQGQWPPGRPSHALSYRANVETAIWAAMQEREVAEGCTQCHTTQNTCNQCHTRHEFSAAEARQPEVCANCHNGVDHNEYENYLLSRHGILYKANAHHWDWNVRLADAYAHGQKFPTCQTCHMEFEGKYSHNMVQKVRWGFAPMKSIADNLGHPWFEQRKESWLRTCGQCHSRSFASAWFDMIDKGTTAGIGLVEEARAVMTKLYDDKLLVGQTTNRPAPPAPDKDEAGGFFGLFWSKGNNPTRIDVEFAEMWEQHIMRHFKGLAHVNPGGFTYSEGWSKLIRSLARIRDEDTRLRDRAAMLARVQALEARQGTRQGELDGLDRPRRWASLGFTMAGAGLLTLGFGAWRRRKA
jgi:hydroxylamine dehydrogenase